MILTRKRLLDVDIFVTCSLSKSLAFCGFAGVNFKPWKLLNVLVLNPGWGNCVVF